MSHTCRGTINLANAFIHTEDSCSFVISNGGTQTFHLKASSEVERQRWVTALELAKAKAVSLIDIGKSIFLLVAFGGVNCLFLFWTNLTFKTFSTTDLLLRSHG